MAIINVEWFSHFGKNHWYLFRKHNFKIDLVLFLFYSILFYFREWAKVSFSSKCINSFSFHESVFFSNVGLIYFQRWFSTTKYQKTDFLNEFLTVKKLIRYKFCNKIQG
jgi:hypothetical protein